MYLTIVRLFKPYMIHEGQGRDLAMHAAIFRPSVLLYGKVRPHALVNRLSYRMLQSMLSTASESSLKAFWKARYDELVFAERSAHDCALMVARAMETKAQDGA